MGGLEEAQRLSYLAEGRPGAVPEHSGCCSARRCGRKEPRGWRRATCGLWGRMAQRRGRCRTGLGLCQRARPARWGLHFPAAPGHAPAGSRCAGGAGHAGTWSPSPRGAGAAKRRRRGMHPAGAAGATWDNGAGTPGIIRSSHSASGGRKSSLQWDTFH